MVIYHYSKGILVILITSFWPPLKMFLVHYSLTLSLSPPPLPPFMLPLSHMIYLSLPFFL